MDDNDFIPIPEGGSGKLRRLLAQLKEDQEKLDNNPLYKEGYDDGYERGKQEAERRAQHIISGLVRLYDES